MEEEEKQGGGDRDRDGDGEKERESTQSEEGGREEPITCKPIFYRRVSGNVLARDNFTWSPVYLAIAPWPFRSSEFH